MNRSLYEIGADLDALAALLDEVGGDVTEAEAEAAIDQWLQETGEAVKDKLDRYAALLRELSARAAARAEESARLAALAAVDENNAARLKARVLAFLQERGVDRVETARFRLTVCANGGRAPLRLLVPPSDIPSAWTEQVVSLRPRTEAIRAELEAGILLPFATLEPRGFHLRVR